MLACLPGVGTRAADREPPRLAGPTAGGRLNWSSSDELDLIGDVWADLPFPVNRTHSVTFGIDTRTSIEKTDSELTFLVRDFDYHLELGWRGAPAGLGGKRLSAYLGQRGKQRVDADGQAFARYLGIGLESAGFRDFRERGRIEWRVAGGPVLDDREVRADFVLRAATEIAFRERWGAELSIDGLFEDSGFDGDVRLGPSYRLAVAGGLRTTLFLHYQRSRNPLGIGDSAVLVGFEYAKGRHPVRAAALAPAIDGVVGLGQGEDGRLAGQLKLRVHSPTFGRELAVAFVVDANLLTADDTGDLYYFLDGGVEKPLGGRTVGAYIYHRSNHQWAEPNDRVTSLNVVEVGTETSGWHRPGARSIRSAWGAIDARARAGILINSKFGEDRWWHVRGGLRWTLPLGRGRAPYLLVEAEAGDADRQLYAIGLSVSREWDAQLEFRNDEQLFSSDRNVLLLSARYGF
jgi:hypothetical protein